MSIRRVIASVTFDPPIDDQEEAIQTLGEAVLDESASLTFDHADPAASIEDDPNLALWFTPQAIREHFNARSLGGDGDPANDELFLKVADMTDEQLVEVGRACLSNDDLYETFHECLVMELED